MSKKLIAVSMIALGSALTPMISSAADSTEPTTMPKDSWLSSMTPMLPDLICKGFIQDPDLKKRFDEIKMSYEQCVSLIPKSSTKCQNELYANIPDTITAENAPVWGKSLGECIGKDFAENYLIPKS